MIPIDNEKFEKIEKAVKEFDENADDTSPLDIFLEEIDDSPFYCGAVRTKSYHTAYDIIQKVMENDGVTSINITKEPATGMFGYDVWTVSWEED